MTSLLIMGLYCFFLEMHSSVFAICNNSLLLFVPDVKLGELYTAWYWIALIFYATETERVLTGQMDSNSTASAHPRGGQKVRNLLQSFHVFYNLGELFTLHLGFNRSSSDQDFLPMRRISFSFGWIVYAVITIGAGNNLSPADPKTWQELWVDFYWINRATVYHQTPIAKPLSTEPCWICLWYSVFNFFHIFLPSSFIFFLSFISFSFIFLICLLQVVVLWSGKQGL